MAKLVECKACKKEVAQNAKVCPHCGQKNPGVNGKNIFIGFVVAVAIISFLLSGDGSNEKTIYKKDYGEKWAFTTDEAKLICVKDDVANMPLIRIEGRNFGLTGYADNRLGQGDINALYKYWLKDEAMGKGVYKDLDPFMKEAKALCEN